MRLKIDWASLIVGSKFTVFSLFYFVIEGNFPSTSPRGLKSNYKDHWVVFCTLNNNLKEKYNPAKWNHFKDLADKLKTENNSKPFWYYIK